MWILLPPPPTLLFWMPISNEGINWFMVKRAGSAGDLVMGYPKWPEQDIAEQTTSPFSELFWIQERWDVILWNTKQRIQGRWYNLTHPLWYLIFWSVLATQDLNILKIAPYVLCSHIPALPFLALALASILCCCKRGHKEQTCFY